MEDQRTLSKDKGLEELYEQLRKISGRVKKTEEEFREVRRLLWEMEAWLSVLEKLFHEQADKGQAIHS